MVAVGVVAAVAVGVEVVARARMTTIKSLIVVVKEWCHWMEQKPSTAMMKMIIPSLL